jgi:hypothetical protein
MIPQSENGGAQSLVAGGFVHDGERTARYERDDDNDSYYGSVHCNPPVLDRSLPMVNATHAKADVSFGSRRRSSFCVMLYPQSSQDHTFLTAILR